MNVAESPRSWRAAGAPLLPALLVDGVSHSLGHPVQVATLLGLAGGAVQDPVSTGWDLHRVLEAWLDALALVPWAAVLEETPSRGRTTRELAINTFVPVGLLPAAFIEGRFAWPGDPLTGEPGDDALRAHELRIEASITGTESFAAFAEPIRLAWAEFLLEEEQALRAAPDRDVATPAGSLPYGALLDAQRMHAAQHYRQVTTFFEATGRKVPDFRPESLGGLHLPAQVY